MFLCAFIPLLVFFHGCFQCVYPSSMWQHHLSMGWSIYVCHHGPDHLQSQVLTPTMFSYSISDSETHCFFRRECGFLWGSVCQLCFLRCCFVLYSSFWWHHSKLVCLNLFLTDSYYAILPTELFQSILAVSQLILGLLPENLVSCLTLPFFILEKVMPAKNK